VWIHADATRLAQAVANLLHNARKFSERGTTVRVALGLEGGRALVEVQDQGAGIDPALVPRLFEPFAQADRTLARSSGGLGIGLHVVQGLLRLHGGEVTAHSDGAGKGSRFRLGLPVAPPPARPPSPDAPVAPRGKLRILVVEDNEDAAEMLGLLLSSSGHEVRLAHRAADAITVLDEWRAEVILSDIGLPDMDGFDLPRAIRQRQRGQRRPLLIAITGYGNEAYRVKAREAGFDLHLTKPVDVRTLEQMLSGAGVS
jgi:CheY-like chemotaxis protein